MDLAAAGKYGVGFFEGTILGLNVVFAAPESSSFLAARHFLSFLPVSPAGVFPPRLTTVGKYLFALAPPRKYFDFPQVSTFFSQALFDGVHLGVCVPGSCSEEEVARDILTPSLNANGTTAAVVIGIFL